MSQMTHDRFVSVPPYNARIKGGNEPERTSVRRSRPRPPWLPDGPLTDRVRLTACLRCGRPVLEALAEGVLAARVDPVILSPAAELAHLIAGGITLRLWPEGGQGDRHLAFRSLVHIRAHPGRGLPCHSCDRNYGPPDFSLFSKPLSTATQEPEW